MEIKINRKLTMEYLMSRVEILLITFSVLLVPIIAYAQPLFVKSQNYCAEIVEKVKQGVLLIDVRTKDEFSSGALAGAINVPYDQIESQLHLFPADKQKEIILYCKSGRRSELGKQTLTKLGYKHVVNAGGYADLIKCWDKK